MIIMNTCCLCRSLGCTVVEMLSGKPPWSEIKEYAALVYAIVTSHKPNYNLPDHVTDIAKDFLERCFIRDSHDRPSANELLSDPFVCDVS